jgi:hypothetical protein
MNYHTNSSRKLIDHLKDIIKNKNSILSNELSELKNHLENVFSKKEHRYLTYYALATDLSYSDETRERGYLVHTLALIFEAIGFYLKSNFSRYGNGIKNYIDEQERKIGNNSKLDYYRLTEACRSFLFYNKLENLNSFFEKKHIDLIYSRLEKAKDIEAFKKFASRVKKLRNNLLHANSGNILNGVEDDIKNVLKDFKKYCIDDDILNQQDQTLKNSKITEPIAIPACKTNSIITPKKQKAKPKQSEEDIKLLKNGASRLSDMFNNR